MYNQNIVKQEQGMKEVTVVSFLIQVYYLFLCPNYLHHYYSTKVSLSLGKSCYSLVGRLMWINSLIVK